MKKLKIAVWTTNEDKISWIQLWIGSLISWNILNNLDCYQRMIREIIRTKFKKGVMINPYKTESWVNEMPTSLNETILWAKNRVMFLINNWVEADYYIWTEWWTHDILDTTLLFSTVCITNSSWKSHIWTSNWIELPKILVEKIKWWMDLSEAFLEEHISIPNWSISWALSVWEFSRENQFLIAFNSAIKPFFNERYY